MKNTFLTIAFVLYGVIAYASYGEGYSIKPIDDETNIIENDELMMIAGVSYKLTKGTNLGNESASYLIKDKSCDEGFCRVKCRVVIGGQTYQQEAGWFLSSCTRAAQRCQEKLDAIIPKPFT